MSGARLGRELLQAPDALAGLFVHPLHELGRRRGDVVIEPGSTFKTRDGSLARNPA